MIPDSAKVMVADSSLGKIIVDDKGMTLYMFGKDTPDKSNCSGNCLKAWPPLVTQGSPVLGDGVDKSLVGSATMADGSKIVTYNHMPLYYWVKDTKAGNTTGQNVGKVWFVVAPSDKAPENFPTSGGSTTTAPAAVTPAAAGTPKPATGSY